MTDVRDTVRAYRTDSRTRRAAAALQRLLRASVSPSGDLLDLLIARARVPVHVRVDPARFRPNDMPLLVGDPTRLRDELGWTPAIPLEQTLDDVLEYWRDEMPMKILVTGGTGYLGRAVVRALAGPRATTRRVRPHRDAERPARRASSTAIFAIATRSNAPPPAAMRSRTRPALVSIWRRRREDFDDVNVGGLRNVLGGRGCRKLPRMLYTSSFLALPPRDRTVADRGQRLSAHEGRGRSVADDAVRAAAPLMRVYPGVVYGPGTLHRREPRRPADRRSPEGPPARPGRAGEPWSYAYVDDVAAGHRAALERGRAGARYMLGGENAPQQRVFESCTGLTGRRATAAHSVSDRHGPRRRRGAARGDVRRHAARSREARSRSSGTTGRSTAPAPSASSATDDAARRRRSAERSSRANRSGSHVSRVIVRRAAFRIGATVGAHRIGAVRAAAAIHDVVAGAPCSPPIALLFNLVLLPRLGGRRLYRPVDDARGFPIGILLYPLVGSAADPHVPDATRHRRGRMGRAGVRRRCGHTGRAMSWHGMKPRPLKGQPSSRKSRCWAASRSRGIVKRRSPARSRSSCSAARRAPRSRAWTRPAVVPPPPWCSSSARRSPRHSRQRSSRRFRFGSTTTSRSHDRGRRGALVREPDERRCDARRHVCGR